MSGLWEETGAPGKTPTQAQEEHADSLETPGMEPSGYEATVSHSQLIKYLNQSSLGNSASSVRAVKCDVVTPYVRS